MLVWELLAADLSLSPVHRAGIGLVAAGRGISLRFPRFVRQRDDKKPDQATTGRQIASLYRKQVGSAAGRLPEDDDGDDEQC